MRSEKEQADRQLFGTMDRVSSSVGIGGYADDKQDTNRGLQAVSRIAKSLKLSGVHGPLYSLFEVEERYKTAVEVTAGNRCAEPFRFLRRNLPLLVSSMSSSTMTPPLLGSLKL